MGGTRYFPRKDNDMEKTLFNLKHSFDGLVGENVVTVRKGRKWSEVQIGTKLNLKVQQTPEDAGVQVGTGEVIGFWYGPFRYIDQALVIREHNLSARNYGVLLDQLKEAYPGFDEDTEVTALQYKVISRD
jgi:hypothetical protein